MAKNKHKIKKIILSDFETIINLKKLKNYYAIFKNRIGSIPIFFTKGKILLYEEKNYVATISDVNLIAKFLKGSSEAKLKGKLKKTGERFEIALFKKIFQKIFSLLKPKNLFGFKNGITKNGIIDFVTENSNVNFLKSSKFIDKEFINDKDNLIKFYESKGYRDIKIIKDSITYEGDFINIDIYVNPGNRYYFRNINWTGNYIYDKKLLNEILSI